MNLRTVIAYTLIGLAGIGLVSLLLNNPGELVRQIGLIALSAIVIFFIFRLVMKRRIGGNKEDRAFAKAAKQSKKRFNSPQATASSPVSYKKKPAAKKKSKHLKVIDGKKGKRSNRVSS